MSISARVRQVRGDGNVDLRLRKVRHGDCRMLWRWANDPETRAASFDTARIPYGSHCDWFAARLRSRNCRWFVGETPSGIPVGAVRFERRGGVSAGEWIVSVVVAPEWRGKRLATPLIRMACDELWSARARPLKAVAFVKAENDKSLRAFKGAGFRVVGRETVRQTEAWRLECCGTASAL